MERLTKPIIVPEIGEVLAYMRNLGVTDTKVMTKLGKYEDLEEQGLLMRLPVKVGDTVFVIPSRVNCALNRLNGYSENNRVYVQRVHSIQMYSNDRYLLTTCEGLESVLSDTYKETWFLTREEAKAALEKMKGEHNVVT